MFNSDLQTLLSAIKEKIEKLYKCCICNKLIINSKKYFILFHTVNKPIPQNLTEIFTTQVTIKRVTEMKYLGLVLDE